MAYKAESGYYFETDTDIERSRLQGAKSKNRLGKPINIKHKILAAIADPWDDSKIWVALSIGAVQSVTLDGKISPPYYTANNHNRNTPVTCLAIAVSPTDNTQGNVYAGSWDRNVYAWPLSGALTNEPSKTFHGHEDFVKSLVAIPGTSLLASGSADRKIIIWDTSLGVQVTTVHWHARPPQTIAFGGQPSVDVFRMYSADSIGEIVAWDLTLKKPIGHDIVGIPLNRPTEDLIREGNGDLKHFRPHDTGIFDVKLLGANLNDVEVWTASADKTSRLVSLTTGATDLILPHPDFVKCVLPVPALNLVVTGCRDGDVRVWDSATGELKYRLLGHWAEVTGIILRGSGISTRMASLGIDGTIRLWSLNDDELATAAAEGEAMAARNWKRKEGPTKESIQLTAEEEAELAELMDDE